MVIVAVEFKYDSERFVMVMDIPDEHIEDPEVFMLEHAEQFAKDSDLMLQAPILINRYVAMYERKPKLTIVV